MAPVDHDRVDRAARVERHLLAAGRLLAVIVTVPLPPSASVPPDGLTVTEPFPWDTVADQVTGPPWAPRKIVAPHGGSHSGPPRGNTSSVPAGGFGVGVA